MTVFSKIFRLFSFPICFFLISGCGNDGDKKGYPNSGMYDFANPKIIRLQEDISEISGIAYYPKDTSIFAIIDEDGILFKISLKHPNNFRQWKFDKKRDFEDVVLIDNSFFVLVSNGDIEKIDFKGDSIKTSRSNFSDFSKAENEFEAMYVNNDSNNIILICKTCEGDPKKTISRFSFDYKDPRMQYKPFLSINMAPVAEKLDINKHLKPSAAAINPITGDLYVLSSIQKLMVLFDKQGEFKELFRLDPAIYKQPEGIAFTPEGDLIISNEFAEDGFATLLLMKNKKKEK